MHLLGMWNVPGSVHGISGYKNLVAGDKEDMRPGEMLLARVDNTDLEGLVV